MKRNMKKLNEKITKAGMTQKSAARMLGICQSTLYRKLRRGENAFTIGEINRLVEGIPLTSQEAIDIFLSG